MSGDTERSPANKAPSKMNGDPPIVRENESTTLETNGRSVPPLENQPVRPQRTKSPRKEGKIL